MLARLDLLAPADSCLVIHNSEEFGERIHDGPAQFNGHDLIPLAVNDVQGGPLKILKERHQDLVQTAGHGDDRGELPRMMRADEVQQMNSHVFRCRREIFPRISVLDAQLSPQRVHQFESDGDVSHQFTELVITHYESVFRQRVLPKFSGIVEQNSRE